MAAFRQMGELNFNLCRSDKEIARLKKEMQQAARDLQFEEAAVIRDRIRGIKENLLFS